MTKFRWYIIDSDVGEVWGTNDATIAESHTVALSLLVIDTETAKWITAWDSTEIKEQTQLLPSYFR